MTVKDQQSPGDDATETSSGAQPQNAAEDQFYEFGPDQRLLLLLLLLSLLLLLLLLLLLPLLLLCSSSSSLLLARSSLLLLPAAYFLPLVLSLLLYAAFASLFLCAPA
jgi:uncharacterized BrkB/YihY/UPF0761 family membrane protein